MRVFSFEKDIGCSALQKDEIGFEGLKINLLLPFGRILAFRHPWTDPVLDTDPKHPAIFRDGRAKRARQVTPLVPPHQ